MILSAVVALALQAEAPTPGVGVNYTDAMLSAYSGRPAVLALRRVARCIVSRHRAAAHRLLLTVPGTDEEDRILWGPVRSRLDQCAMTGVYVSNVLLRGALAEALQSGAPGGSAGLAAPVAVAPFRWAASNRDAATLAPIYDLGRCVVAADPGAVRRFLASDPFTPGEGREMRALRPTLEPCLDRGMTFNTNRETLRAILAESLYRWSLVQDGGGSAR